MKQAFTVAWLAGWCCSVSAQSTRYDSLWNDPAVETRIQQGIETHRKGDFTLVLADRQGKPLRNTTVEIQQVGHDFQFGANIFMLNGFKAEADNRKYEETFRSLFNTACIPFYWKTLEPEQGKLRFAANSSPIYRRPPPDVVVDFCRANVLTPKGHTLVWDHPKHSVPDWLPTDTTEVKRLITKRIQEIAARYGNAIKTWDVVNEVLKGHPDIPMPGNYALFAFQEAQKYFPADTRLFINEVTGESWQNYRKEYSPYYLLIESLKAKGARIGGIGLQFHFFSEPLHEDVANGKAMTPTDLFRALDQYGRFGVPLHVSEITIPTLPNNQMGLQRQARMARNFYRLWFSHPAVEAVIWWNVADGTAVAGEDKWNGGLVNGDFSPKPAYTVLNVLINREWKTALTLTPQDAGPLRFRGFYGEYLVRIRQGKKVTEQRIHFRKNQPSEVRINL
ncbi:glycoside hydrolase family 10 [Fibrisoma montanum]|uniref:Beta-xylanase n=1 Tax=Fibrisoma montanum TaxID=2305895 RepID=A0A418MKC2_9BACT|nr:endo-1,4-beta-xylanase [Fibrisoma montanum]RIV27849.1 glycoside hydrolase family 10 [Fibrisoma montanum]